MKTRTRLLFSIAAVSLSAGRANACYYHWLLGLPEPTGVWPTTPNAAASQLQAQDAADDQEYRQYKTELDSIRAKYDPNRDLTDPDSISQQYKDELSALHDKHEEMLTRKFGA